MHQGWIIPQGPNIFLNPVDNWFNIEIAFLLTHPHLLSLSPAKPIEGIPKESTIDDLRKSFESMIEKTKAHVISLL